MVMKIVKHYGSEVLMNIDEEVYDAGSALDIFRANEKISAKKRQLILQEIKPCCSAGEISREALKPLIYEEIDRLVQKGLIGTYEALTVDDLNGETQESPTLNPQEIKPLVAKEIRRLMAAGKIDIKVDVYATFKGDRRALKDIEALARANYGEDAAGNNIELPAEIDYLRK